MNVVGIRELKNRLSEYIRMVRAGEDVLITDRGRVVAELRQPGAAADVAYPALLERAAGAGVRLGGDNRPDLYPRLDPCLTEGEASKLLDEERGER